MAFGFRIRVIIFHSVVSICKYDKICLKMGVALVNEKMKENYLRWFGLVQRKMINIPLRKGELKLRIRKTVEKGQK